MVKVSKVLKSLQPTAEWSIYNGELTWLSDDIPQPSEAEIQAELTRLQAEYDSQEYARNRKDEYNKLNQLEMQFDDQRDGTTTWTDAINEIKGRYPK